jgi:hypothetical protein
MAKKSRGQGRLQLSWSNLLQQEKEGIEGARPAEAKPRHGFGMEVPA